MFGFAVTTWATLGFVAVLGGVSWWATRRWTVSYQRVWPYVWISSSVVATLYAVNAVWRHMFFETHAFDLAIFDQAIWHLSRLQAPASTIRGVANLFGDHFHPIISLFIPLYWLFNSPVVLLIGQAALLALVGPIVFAVAHRLRLPAIPAAIIAFAIAANPGMLMATNFDFHEVAFAPVLFFSAVWAFESRHWRWYWAAIGGLVLTKESLTLYVALLGFMFVLRRCRAGWHDRSIWHALATMVIGISAFFLITRLVIPSISNGQGYTYWHQYSAVGATPMLLVKNIIVHPIRTFGFFFDHLDKRLTMKEMLATSGFLPLLSWSTWPLLVLALGERFWTSSYGIWLFQFHYQLNMVAVFGISVLYVAHDAERWKWFRGVSAVFALMLIAGTGWTYSKLQPWKIYSDPTILSRPIQDWDAALAKIPAKVPVSAQDAFVPHLAHRQGIYQAPTLANAQWLILDPRAPSWPMTSDQVKVFQQTIKRDPAWHLVMEKDSLTVFQR